MPLHGHFILIVEPSTIPFVHHLQQAIEHEGGESIVARHPSTALARCERYPFTAALVNSQHVDLAAQLRMPALVYDVREGHRSVLARLRTRLLVPPTKYAARMDNIFFLPHIGETLRWATSGVLHEELPLNIRLLLRRLDRREERDRRKAQRRPDSTTG